MQNIDDIDCTLLPNSAKQLIDNLGIAGAFKIIRERGGTRVYVPFEIHADHWLVDVLGRDLAVRFSKMAGGDQFLLPQCRHTLRALRDREIVRRHRAGEVIWKLTLEFGMSESQVWKICSPPKQETQSVGVAAGND